MDVKELQTSFYPLLIDALIVASWSTWHC